MKKQTFLFYIFLFVISVLATQATAKTGKELAQQIAPLINQDTNFVLHFDLSGFDFPKISNESLEKNEEFFKALNLDEKSVQGLSRETKKLILKGRPKVQKYVDVLTKQCKISDVYMICQQFGKKDFAFFFAIPIENRTVKQRETLKAVLEQPLSLEYISEIFEKNGFQIFVIYGDSEPTVSLEKVQDGLEQENAELLQFFSPAFPNSEKTKIQAILVLKPHLADPPTNFSSETDERIEKLLQETFLKFQFVSFSYDFAQGKSEINIHTKSQEDVRAIESNFGELSKLIAKSIDENIAKEAKNSSDFAFLSPFLQEFTKGFMKAVLPKSEGNRFVLKLESPLFNAVVINFSTIGAHFAFSPLEIE